MFESFKEMVKKLKEMPESERKKKIFLAVGLAFFVTLLLGLLFGK